MARGYARYVLAVMVGINFLNYMDRWVAAAASPLIQTEFHLSDAQIRSMNFYVKGIEDKVPGK